MFQLQNVSLPGAHALVGETHPTEQDVFELRQFPSQSRARFDQLFEVQLLRNIGRNEDFLRMVRIDAIAHLCQVARRIERRTVAFHDQIRRHVLLLRELDDERTFLPLHEHTLLLSLCEYRFHFVFVEAFAEFEIIRHLQTLEDVAERCLRHGHDVQPERSKSGITLFELLKCIAAFLFQRFVVLQFIMEFHVQRQQFVECMFLHRLLAAP